MPVSVCDRERQRGIERERENGRVMQSEPESGAAGCFSSDMTQLSHPNPSISITLPRFHNITVNISNLIMAAANNP